MIILGIDPGTTRIGYGVIQAERDVHLLDCGILKISSKTNIDRIWEAVNHFHAIIKKYAPDFVSIEKLFFVNNQKTGLQVAEVRGALLYGARESNIKVLEYAPTEIKNAVAGSGRADKKSVQKMVEFSLKERPGKMLDDVYDAIAAALTAAYDMNNRAKIDI